VKGGRISIMLPIINHNKGVDALFDDVVRGIPSVEGDWMCNCGRSFGYRRLMSPKIRVQEDDNFKWNTSYLNGPRVHNSISNKFDFGTF
jgi:hypothetical protein